VEQRPVKTMRWCFGGGGSKSIHGRFAFKLQSKIENKGRRKKEGMMTEEAKLFPSLRSSLTMSNQCTHN
jgi:hypothetical protein